MGCDTNKPIVVILVIWKKDVFEMHKESRLLQNKNVKF